MNGRFARVSHRFVSVVILFSLLLSPLAAAAGLPPTFDNSRTNSGEGVSREGKDTLYRTRVRLRHAADRQRLASLVTRVLAMGDDWALVVVDGDQLATLARLQLRPRGTDTLAALGFTRASLSHSNLLNALTYAANSDSDGDGLTDTEEGWWCTDANDSDSDNDLVNDGQEITQLLDGNYEDGKPFVGWPSDHPGCYDDDSDSIPDAAEVNVIGLNLNRESTDGDKFDDGQEFFGITKYPNYGALPRLEDTFITQNMPGWVDPSGDSPFVAAYPEIRVNVLPETIEIELVTTITVAQGHSEGETFSYSTTDTVGTSIGVGKTESHTWSEWQEIGNSVADSYEQSNYQSEMRSSMQQYSQALMIGSTVETENGGEVTVGTEVGAEFTLSQGVNASVGFPKVVEVGGSAEASQSLSVGLNFSAAESWAERSAHENQVTNVSTSGWEVGQETGESFTYGRTYESSVTHGTGYEYGIATTITREDYEEHAISQGQALGTEQQWSTAVATDTAHTADLSFAYRLQNVGTDNARVVENILFNVYIGSELNPISVLASNTSGDTCVPVTIANLYPGDYYPAAGNATQCDVPLSLEQFKAIDLGEPIRIIVADYDYGDDNSFYENAWGTGVIFEIDDGVTDGDESIDLYLIPTVNTLMTGDETYQDLLDLYFDITVENCAEPACRLTGIRTPEYDANHEITEWNWHNVSTLSWWTIYLGQFEENPTYFHDTLAKPETRVLLRFDEDSDGDLYSDRSENAADPPTDPYDPNSRPKAQLLAGYTEIRSGDVVTVQMAFENTGTFDASGVEATLFTPDSTVTPGVHPVGLAGLVRAGARVNLGAKVDPADTTGWTGTAAPISGGAYTGGVDKTFTFTAATAGFVGQTAGLTLDWDDGAGNSDSLNVGSGYNPPFPLTVFEGVEIALGSGDIVAGQSFTVDALIPKDVFTYTIESEPYTPPAIIVSYNDPEGNRRFITPVALTDLSADLSAHAGEMLDAPLVEIFALDAFDPAATNTTHFSVYNPLAIPVVDGHLLLAWGTEDGLTVATQEITTTFQPGPNLLPVIWETSTFDPAYVPTTTYKLRAYVSDWSRIEMATELAYLDDLPTELFPAAAVSATAWDFGTVTQGETPQTTLAIANTGRVPLRAYPDVSGSAGLTAQSGSGLLPLLIGPGAFATVTLQLDTAAVPTGTFSVTLPIRTNDPADPQLSIQVTGVISPLIGDVLAYDVSALRPWDQTVYVVGPHNLNDIVTFDHTITDNPDQVHPIYVYSEDGSMLLGVGEFGPDFTGQTTPFGIFGDGSDGDFAGGDPNIVRTALSGNANAGQPAIAVLDSSNFFVGDEIIIIQVQGTGAGNYEFATIAANSPGTLTVQRNLNNTYYQDSTSKAQVLLVPHFNNVSGTISPGEWNGSTGGFVVFRALNIDGVTVDVSTKGFKGGYGNDSAIHIGGICNIPGGQGQQGTSHTAFGGCSTVANAGGGGGGGYRPGADFGSGGGGGYGSSGGNGSGPTSGVSGASYGTEDLSTFFLGSGGGGGNWGTNPYGGGRSSIQGNDFSGQGAGAVFIAAKSIGGLNVYANGNIGGNSNGGFGGYAGGGGSGGSIKIVGGTINLGAVQALGGAGGDGLHADGGNGGVGRIRIEYCNSFTGSTNPPASTQQLTCYIIRQLPGSPNTELTLPEAITSYARYLIQYGQRGTFTQTVGIGTQDYAVTLPKRTYDSLTLDGLFENLASSTFAFTLDIGADSSVDWSGSGTEQPVILSSPDLAEALNTYLEDTPEAWGEDVVVHIRVTLDTTGDVFLTNLVATPGADSDPKVEDADLSVSDAEPTETDVVTVTAVVHNLGNLPAANVLATFYDGDPAVDGFYLGSDFLPTIPAGGSDTATLAWDTTGYTGTVELFVVLDAAGQLAELDETNNTATITATVKSRPELLVAAVTPGDDARQNVPLTVTVTISNSGQTDAALQTVSLYDGDPDDNGILLGSDIVPVPAGLTATVPISWTPTELGSKTLYAVADSGDVVNEPDETNNTITQTVTVGLGAPVYIDAGSAADTTYDAAKGYGWLPPGGIPLALCGAQPNQTSRQMTGITDQLQYQFDHLLPSRSYHLDLTLYLCGGTSQTIQVLVDGVVAANAIAVSSLQPVYLSVLLDPVHASDNKVVITFKQSGGSVGPAVAELTLRDAYYCYRDSGMAGEVDYVDAADGCGPLDGFREEEAWGTLPYQTYRYDLGSSVRYQFDDLEAGKAYQLGLVFYDQLNSGRVQSVRVDNVTVLSSITPTSTPITLTAEIAPAAYASDGSIVVAISGGFQPIVNEIWVEERTVPQDTGFRSPTANAPLPGGDGNGFQSNPTNAYADDGLYALDSNSGTSTSGSCANSGKDRHGFGNYGFALPTDRAITGIEVRLDARVDNGAANPKFCVQLSSDGGLTWTTPKQTIALKATEGQYILGSQADLWGRAWSAADFNNAAFRLRIISVATDNTRDFALDWAAVRVHYK